MMFDTIYASISINYPNTINPPLTTPLVAKIFSFSLETLSLVVSSFTTPSLVIFIFTAATRLALDESSFTRLNVLREKRKIFSSLAA